MKKYVKYEESAVELKVYNYLKDYEEVVSYRIEDNFMFINLKTITGGSGQVVSMGNKDTSLGQSLKQQKQQNEKVAKEIMGKLMKIIPSVEDSSFNDNSKQNNIFLVSDEFFNFDKKKVAFKRGN